MKLKQSYPNLLAQVNDLTTQLATVTAERDALQCEVALLRGREQLAIEMCAAAGEPKLKARRLEAQLVDVTAERDKWRDYFGCDSPHDCFLGANSKFDPDRIIGKEQARANRAENQLKEMRAEFDAARKLAESLGVRGQTEDHDYLCIKSRELI